MPTEILLNESEALLVRRKETVTLQPRCKQVVRSTLDGRKRSFHKNFVFVEPARIPNEGICAVRVLTRIRTERTAGQLTDVKVTIKSHSGGVSQDAHKS